MPFVKVHISSTELPAVKPLLVKKLREVLVEVLQLDEKLGQVVLYEALPQYRATHPQRSRNYVFIEILLHGDRTLEAKTALMKGMIEQVSTLLGLDSSEINCCLTEVSSENWYGGLSHS